MRILLANIPWRREGRCGVRAGSRWPHIKDHAEGGYMPFPFFLAYSAALLKKNNFNIEFIDAIAEGLSETNFLHHLKSFNPDLILIETSTVSLHDDLAFIEKIDEQFPIALSGPDVNIRKKEFLKHNKRISYVLKGEYEYTLLDLARNLAKNLDLKEVAGINFRNRNGDICLNPGRPLIKDLSSLPWPLREGLPMEKYLDAPGGMPLPSVQMLASRGCPHGCIFCLWPQVMYGGRNYRLRHPKDVVSEMAYLVRGMKFRSIYFDDDTFGLDQKWLGEFIQELKNTRLNVPWAIMARADHLDARILGELKSVGLFAVKYGIESAAQELVNRSGKNLNLKKAEETIKHTKELGIKVHLTFMFGLPGETKETIRRTIDFALGLDPHSVQFSLATPFPGTQYFDELKERGLLVSQNWSDYDGNYKAVFNTTELSAMELKQTRERAYFIWGEHCRRRGDYSLSSLMKKFSVNIRTFGLIYTAKKTLRMIKRKRLQLTFNLRVGKKHLNIPNRMKHYTREFIHIMGILEGAHAYIGPYLAQIDLTNRCNNNCIGCWCNSPLLDDKHMQPSEKEKALPYELVKDVIDELYIMYTKEIYLAGGGEPFMHPNIMDIVKHIKKRHMVCYINTNFTLVDKTKAQELVGLGVEHLTVSMWAGTPRTYALTHPNKDENTFVNIKRMLKFITSLRKKGTPPYVKLYNVISNVNYHEIEQMVEFALETGVDSVEFTVIDTIPGETDVLLLSDKERETVTKKCYEIQHKFGKSLSNNGLKLFQFSQFLRRISTDDASSGEYDKDIIDSVPCSIGWVFTRIMADGNVNAHRIPVGNIYKQRFREIWNGTLQKEFRRKTSKPKKDDPFFSFIGNDPNVKVGCYKGCDDLGRNLHNHKILAALPPPAKIALRLTSKAIKNIMISRPIKVKQC